MVTELLVEYELLVALVHVRSLQVSADRYGLISNVAYRDQYDDDG